MKTMLLAVALAVSAPAFAGGNVGAAKLKIIHPVMRHRTPVPQPARDPVTARLNQQELALHQS